MFPFTCLLRLVAILLHPSLSITTQIVTDESRMAVYTHGFKVGEIISRYARQGEGGHDVVNFTSHTRINAVAK